MVRYGNEHPFGLWFQAAASKPPQVFTHFSYTLHNQSLNVWYTKANFILGKYLFILSLSLFLLWAGLACVKTGAAGLWVPCTHQNSGHHFWHPLILRVFNTNWNPQSSYYVTSGTLSFKFLTHALVSILQCWLIKKNTQKKLALLKSKILIHKYFHPIVLRSVAKWNANQSPRFTRVTEWYLSVYSLSWSIVRKICKIEGWRPWKMETIWNARLAPKSVTPNPTRCIQQYMKQQFDTVV